jgi:hypothetical protein
MEFWISLERDGIRQRLDEQLPRKERSYGGHLVSLSQGIANGDALGVTGERDDVALLKGPAGVDDSPSYGRERHAVDRRVESVVAAGVLHGLEDNPADALPLEGVFDAKGNQVNDKKTKQKFKSYVNSCVTKNIKVDERIFYLSSDSDDKISSYKQILTNIIKEKTLIKNPLTYIENIFESILNEKNKDQIKMKLP